MTTEDEIVELAARIHAAGCPIDTFNFTVGPPMRLVDGCRAVRLTRREILVERLRQRWLSATRWFRPRRIVTTIDHDAGSITMSTQRWSWLRWRWL